MATNAENILETCYRLGVDPKVRRQALDTLAETEAITEAPLDED